MIIHGLTASSYQPKPPAWAPRHEQGEASHNRNSLEAPVGAVCPDKFRFEQLPGSRQPRLNRLKVTRTTWGNVA